MDNIVGLTYLKKKMGGNQESENDYTVKRDLGNINFRTDNDYCGVPTQLTQQSAGLGISLHSGLIQMGPLSTGLLQSLPEVRNPNSRFIRFNGVTPISTICCMETRTLQHSHGRNVNSLDTISIPWTQGHCYAFPPFCLIPRVLSKIQQD